MTYDDRRADNEPTRAQLEEQVAELQREMRAAYDHAADLVERGGR